MRLKIAIALAVGLSLWACSARKDKLGRQVISETKEIATLARKHVQNEERREKLLAIQDKVQRMTESFFESLKGSRREWILVNADYESRPDNFAALQRQSSSIRRRHAENLISYAMQARRVATREEWEAMAAEWKD